MVRNEAKKTFEGSWFGPYIIQEAHINTYRLRTLEGHAMASFTHGNRLRKISALPEEVWYTQEIRNARRLQQRLDQDLREGEGDEVVDNEPESLDPSSSTYLRPETQ